MRRAQSAVTVLMSALLATGVVAACGSTDDDAAPSTTASSSTTAASSTTVPPVTATAPPTTTASAETTTTAAADTTTTLAASTSTTAPTATTAVADTEPPPAPTNVTCGPGGGSQEVMLEWDAPADPGDVVDVRLYINDGSGFARVNKFTVESGQVLISATRWSAVAYPVPSSTQIQMAVTVGDAAGNESGWNPIDVYYEFAGAPCVS